MSHTPVDPDAMLSRGSTAKALTAIGFPITEKTLATYACRGGGPVMRYFGRRVLYRWADALDWAKGRMSGPVRTASERGRAA